MPQRACIVVAVNTSKRQLTKFAGANFINCLCDFRGMKTDLQPIRRWQNQNRQASTRQRLLVADALVCRDDEVERVVGGIEQRSILEPGPTHLVGGCYDVIRQVMSQRDGHAVVEEDPHIRVGEFAQA